MTVVRDTEVSSAVKLPCVDDCALGGQRVLIRADLNVPIKDGKVANNQKIIASLATIRFALKQNAAVILLSHLGRPEVGALASELSLYPVAVRLAELLSLPVRFETDYLAGIQVALGEVVLCENVRFNIGETTDDEALSRQLAGLGDVFVMDAFGSAHRAHASTHGVVRFAKHACAGLLFTKEIKALSQAMYVARQPMVGIVGGSKISTKLNVLEALVAKTDYLALGGGIANTLLAAAGHRIGRSLCEKTMLEQAKRLLEFAEQHACVLQLPKDVVCALTPEARDTIEIREVDEVAADEMILDIGPRSCRAIAENIRQAATILWNGPLGLFEEPSFMAGTRCVAQAIAESGAYSIAGGGDTLAAIDQLNLAQEVSYISTGGGAFLEFVEGKPLLAVAALSEHVIQ